VTFKTLPYAHQLKAFELFKDKEYFALFMDMGTGKTKVTIDIAAYKYSKGLIEAMLIIAPNNVHTQWVKEQLPLHCPIPYKAFIWESGKLSRGYYKKQLDDFINYPMDCLKVLAINVEALQSDTIIPYIARFVKGHKPFIVIDEATRIKHNTAKRTKVVHQLTKYGQRAILTGTPTAKSPFDLWSQMEFLRANYFACNYFIFQHRYGIMLKGVNQKTGGKYLALISEKDYSMVSSLIGKMKAERGGQLMPDDYETISAIRGTSEKNVHFIEANPKYTQFKRLDELREYIAKDVYSVKKENCLDLPPKVYEKIYVTMSAEQKKVYHNLKTELVAQYEGKELTVVNKVALTTRLMQIIGGFFPYTEMEEHYNPEHHEWYEKATSKGQLIGKENTKMVALFDDLEEAGEETNIIIWAHFVAELKYIYEALKTTYSCCLYYGGTEQNERKRIIEDFKSGKYRIFIGNAATAGFGLNLQNATLQYYFSNTFRTEDRLQAEDRSHRIGVKSTVVYKDIIMKGTIDEKIHENISMGRDLNDYFKSTSLLDLLKTEEENEDE
jgi:SNF2 family DNA or RNA helicase